MMRRISRMVSLSRGDDEPLSPAGRPPRYQLALLALILPALFFGSLYAGKAWRATTGHDASLCDRFNQHNAEIKGVDAAADAAVLQTIVLGHPSRTADDRYTFAVFSAMADGYGTPPDGNAAVAQIDMQEFIDAACIAVQY